MRASTMFRPELVEHGGGAREAVTAVRRVDRARAVVPRSLLRLHRDQRLVDAAFASAQQPRVPGDLLRRVAQEIGRRQRCPGALDLAGARSCCGASSSRARFLVLARSALPCRSGFPGRGAARACTRLVELLEQRCLPGVPQLRIGAAHVGARSARTGNPGAISSPTMLREFVDRPCGSPMSFFCAVTDSTR